ncbi:anti-sigma factor family protein [Paenibacillus sp. IHBB 10380]|uniref:anti-sigma factor family protein n=1 Tax=Paenibacillus sp. IHBB 10380 TaxID=1566358 RepID=UPI0005CFB558|nr:zf-HC2 domain-containing protein [Paenibacillus sp. IHBB 10380]AJS57657.1 hypothetical protein UB51_03200 [Paenibacillus sp. IHBB 10380]
MNCPEVVEWMHRYLDYDLSEVETADMFEHIAVCPECADTFRVLKLLSRELEDLPIVAPKYSLVDAIMPQLDALDRARKEKSASVDNIPAEMIPTPISQLKDRRRRFMGSTAARTLIGIAAAGVILGVAVLNYSPEQLSDAQVQLSEVTSSSEDGEMAGTASATNGTSGAGLYKDATDTPDTAASMKTEEKATAPEVAASSDPEPEGSNQQQAETGNKVPVIQPNKANSTIEDNKQNSMNSNNKDQVPSSEGLNSSLNDSQKMASNAVSNSGGAVSGNKDVIDSGSAAKSGAEKEGIEAPNLKTIDPAQDQFTARVDSNPSDKSVSTDTIAVSSLWSSPNNKYVAVLEGEKLTINKLPVFGSEELSEGTHTIDLVGTWISGEWSSDSMIFTYQLDQEGKAVVFTYHVDSATVKSP